MNLPTVLVGAAALAVAAAALFVYLRYRSQAAALARAAARVGAGSSEEPIRALLSAVRSERSRGRELEKALSLYERSLARADFGMLVVDPRGEILFANPVARQFIGARHGDAVAEARIRDLVRDVSTTLSEQSLELELYTPSRRYLGLLAVPLYSDEEPPAVVLYLDDMSERRRVESMRKDFVANASHELKTPLGALRVLAETLADTEDTDTRDRLSRRVQDETVRLSHLVDDILDLALVEGAASDLAPLPVDELLEAAHREIAPLSRDHDVTIRLAIEGQPLVVAGDRTQLISAFSNLLENAVKYTAVGVRDREDPVDVRAYRESGDVVVEVQDRGIGISESHQPRVFERFFRVDRARSRETGGTGLGLSIVRHVVENHGGKIDLTSTPGVGSTFVVRLPRWEV